MDKHEINKLAASLRPIDPKIMKQEKANNTKRIWYQGEESYFDVVFELENEEIIWFQFTLRGKSLSWDRNSCQSQTGITNELRSDDVTYYSASKLIKNDRNLDTDFISMVLAILKSRAGEPIFDRALALFEERN